MACRINAFLVIAVISCETFFLLGYNTCRGEDPSTSKSAPLIPTHGLIPEAKAIFEQASEDDAACTKIFEQMKKSGPKPEPLGKLAMHQRRLKRLAERLIDLGESAGAELLARNSIHRAAFEEAFNAFTAIPTFQPIRQKAIANLQRNIPKRVAKAKEVAITAESDPLAAESILDKGLDEFEAVAGILPAAERGSFAEYTLIENNLRPAARAARQQLLNDEILRQSETVASELDLFIQSINAALATVKDGTIAYGDKSIDTIEFIDTLFNEAFAHQAHLQRVIALQYMIKSPGSYFSGPPTAIDPKWSERLHRFRSELSAAVQKLIEADSRQFTASSSIVRLSKYADTLGRYAHRAEGDEWIKAFDEALVAVAKRSGVLSKVGAYHRATSDVLAWRERFAARQEAALSGQSKTLAMLVGESTQKDVTEPGYIQKLPGGKPSPQFLNATYEALPRLGNTLSKDTMAIVRNVVHMDTDKPVWVSRWDNYIYARLPAKFLQAEPTKLLKRSLFIDETHPPLSVRAASALYSAERGDGLTVGATIQEVFAEGAITRLVGLPDIAAPFVGINYPVTLPRDEPAMTVSLRANIVPKWYRHRYFAVPSIAD